MSMDGQNLPQIQVENVIGTLFLHFFNIFKVYEVIKTLTLSVTILIKLSCDLDKKLGLSRAIFLGAVI